MTVTIESSGEFGDSVYDGRAAAYDRLIGSRWYNRLLWDASPDDYAAFAQRAVDSAPGPLLDVAAGTASATCEAYRTSDRMIVLTDSSRDMLTQAARRLAGDGQLRPGMRFVQADAFDLQFAPGGFDTVVSLGFLHLVADAVGFVDGLRAQVRPGGQVFLSSLVAATAVGTRYLRVLHRLGEVAEPRTADDLADLFDTSVRRRGSMAYLELTV